VITDGNTLAYIRKWENNPAFLVILNLTAEAKTFQARYKKLKGRVILSTGRDLKEKEFNEVLRLDANEGMIVQLEKTDL
jgi:hypothetical protein